MIHGLIGFAGRIRQSGGAVGAAELIDAARALTLVDLGDRTELERAVRMCIAWAATEPGAFARIFDDWFCGAPLDVLDGLVPPNDGPSVATVDVDTVPAVGIHTDESVVTDQSEQCSDGSSAEHGVLGASPATGAPDMHGPTVGGRGEPGSRSPVEQPGDPTRRRGEVPVVLPSAPDDAALAFAYRTLAAAIERRSTIDPAIPVGRVAATTAPLSRHERARIDRAVRTLDRQLSGGSSWRRRSTRSGAVDPRRTFRHLATSGGLPREVRRIGPRRDGARLVVLVDLSLSVRGTSRLVLHVVHRIRSTLGSVRAFGFVDQFVPLDRALRTDDAARAIEAVFSLVDVDATSDPGRAFRMWWSRWQHLVTPETHVMVLSDGRCNGSDPGFEVIRRITGRAAATTWVSPEPSGAWSMGRGEMSGYAECVDRALTIRTLDDLERFVGTTGGPRRATPGLRA